MSTLAANPAAPSRADDLFNKDLRSVHAHTDRLFGWLLLAQWAAGIACALWLTPLAWAGSRSSVHPHLLAAIFLGGAITSLPFAFARLMPGAAITRHLIAAAQMLWAALFIDLTGGRVETHFHIFGSLAFLAFYRDWKVLVTATIITATDHAVRGSLWPLTIFGTAYASGWRWLEHAGWVLFEDAFLIPSCLRSLREMRTIAERQALLEEGKATIEQQVKERTHELTAANESLAHNQLALTSANENLVNASRDREQLHQKLLTASRSAGMAEVATGVLHNVGNVLNSVNVSAQVIVNRLHRSEVSSLVQATDMLRSHQDSVADFLSTDERGRHVPAFLIEVAACLAQEQQDLSTEVASILKGVEHIRQVVSMQQEHSKHSSMTESVTPAAMIESALQLQRDSLTRHGVEIVLSLADVEPIAIDKHRVLQVLINLMNNARDAMKSTVTKRLAITTSQRTIDNAPWACIQVQDTGTGIAPENLTHIFNHGFTTKAEGHGFGLHSSAVAAQAMGGTLTAASQGPGHGATFTLLLPFTQRPSGSTPSANKDPSCTAS